GHRDAEILFRDFRVVFADDSAFVDHEDAIGERADLVQLERHEQHGLALVAYLPQPSVDVLDRADVAPTGRLGGHEDVRSAGDVLAADTDLAATRTPQAGESVDQLRLAVAVHAGEADDLAGTYGERHVAHGAEPSVVEDAQVMHLEHGLTGRGRFLLDA